MKIYRGILLLNVIAILFSCKQNDDSDDSSEIDVIGIWQLIEIYLDPGDASGDFELVDSNKTIEFKIDGTLISNGVICQISTDSIESRSATYSICENTMMSPDCRDNGYGSDITFFIDANNDLVLIHPCIESCLSKYTKISN